MTEYFKVIGAGFKTTDNFDWFSALSGQQWAEEKDADVTSNEPCGKGIHVWKDYPRYTVIPYLEDHTFRVEVKGTCLGEDNDKARFRAVRIISLVSKSAIFKPQANLQVASLQYASLQYANLQYANLGDAILQKSTLSDSQIKQCLNYDKAIKA